MGKSGCLNGCIHNKPIKLAEMREKYDFRCAADSSYMKNEDIKQTCKSYQGQYKIHIKTVEDFLEVE
jgi:hypothetical protein